MTPLRDLTDGPRALPVEVTWSPVYEVLASLWSLADKHHFADNDLGHEFYDRAISAMDADRRAQFERLSRGAGLLWLSMFGPAADIDDLTPDRFIESLEASDEPALRRRMLSHVDPDDPESLESAAAGDADAIAAIIDALRSHKPEKGEFIDGLAALLAEPVGSVRDDAADFLRFAFDELFAAHLEEYRVALECDLASTGAMSVTMNPERLIERATNGINYTPQAGVAGYRLIPSAVVRPWALMLEDRGTRIFVYPVADEHLDAAADTPPGWLLAVYKALADERRLKLMRRLAESPAGLGELADHLGVAKSTVHHHVSILRSAGLIRVNVGDLKESSKYSLRPEMLPELNGVLVGYLSPPENGYLSPPEKESS